MTATRVIAYAPNGPSQGPVPTPQDLQVGYPLNDVGALALNYPPDAPRSDLLGQPVELAVEVSWDGGLTWSEPPSSRFLYLRDGRDPIKTGDAFAVEAAGYVLRCQKALVGWASLNSEGVRAFNDATPGAILTALWDEAQARGSLTGMSRTWTATQDSAGTPWPETFSLAYEPGKDLLGVLQEMAEAGWLDYRTQGRSVQVYVADHPSGMGEDRTIGAAPVSLRYGRDLTEAPFRRTWEGLADTAMVAGDNATHLERTNAGALTPWGRQETYVTASGVTDNGTLTVIADAALTLTAQERTEHTFGLDFAAAAHLPFRDYAPGEWVYAATDGSGVQRMRVRQITLTKDANGGVGGNVVLNDRFLESDVLTSRRISRLVQGATQAGTGGQPGSSPGGNDILAPAQVLGLNATSAAYVEDDGRVRSQISLDWNDVTTNADGSVTSDVDHYEVWARRVGASAWVQVAETDLSQWSNSPYEPGQDWEFRVRAVDTVFNRGLFSATDVVTTASDSVGPLKPATPTATSRLGTARITWNGLRDTGAAMDPDFRYVSVHVSQVNGFTADDGNRVGELAGPGYVVAGPLNYASTYYARLVPYDSSGNAGTPSDQVTITVAALVDVSNFPDDAMTDLYARTGQFLDLSADNFSANLIQGSWLQAGTVEADRLSIGARGQTVIRNSFMEQQGAGGVPANWAVQYGGANATLSGETSAPLSGSRSLRLTIAGTGNPDAFVGDQGSEQPTIAGQKWYARVTVRAVQAMASRRVLIQGSTSTPTSSPFNVLDPNAIWHTPGTLGDFTGWTAGQVRTLETTFTVPANHTKGNVQVRFQGTGAANDAFVIDSLEMWPAVTDSQVTEVSAGKIVTGVLQATQRVVAGSLTGARAELNGTGFLAARSDGATTFQVTASDGIARVGGTTGTRIELSRETNIYEANQDWPIVKLWTQGGAGWWPGQLWATYAGGSPQVATTRLASPYFNDHTKAAVLNLTNRSDGTSQAFIQASEVNLTANTYTIGSSGGSADFNLFATNTIIFKQSGGTGQGFALDCSPGTGVVDLRARSNIGSPQPELRLDGSKITLLPGSAGVHVSTGGITVFGASAFNNNVDLNGTADLNITGSGRTVYLPSPPSGGSANVNRNSVNGALRSISSTRRHKKNIKPFQPSMEAMLALEPRIYERRDRQPGDPTHEVGFIAEEALDHGLDEWIEWDAKGRVQGFDYYRWVVALQAMVRNLAAEVAILKADQHPTEK